MFRQEGFMQIIGSSAKRVDAFDKVTGKAKYTPDTVPAPVCRGLQGVVRPVWGQPQREGLRVRG